MSFLELAWLMAVILNVSGSLQAKTQYLAAFFLFYIFTSLPSFRTFKNLRTMFIFAPLLDTRLLTDHELAHDIGK